MQPTARGERRWVEGGSSDLGQIFDDTIVTDSSPSVSGHVFIPRAEGGEEHLHPRRYESGGGRREEVGISAKTAITSVLATRATSQEFLQTDMASTRPLVQS